MSIRYNNASGQETILSGLTPGGDIEAGAVMTRTGKIDVSPLEVGAYQVVNVAFDTPMPDDTYIINIDCTSGRLNIATFNKTANGFSIVYLNSSNLTQLQGDSIDWTATKTYTVQHAAQNAEDITNIKAVIPSTASSTNQLTPKKYVDDADTALDGRVSDLEDLIPTNASVTNQLATKAEIDKVYTKTEVDTKLDDKQDTLIFDNTPTAGSSNPVKSNGIKSAIDDTATDIYKVMGKNGAKNLIPYPYLSTSSSMFTINSDGSVLVNGTAGSSASRFFFTPYRGYYLKAGSYILSDGRENHSSNIYLQVYDSLSPYTSRATTGAKDNVLFTLEEDTEVVIQLNVNANITVTNDLFYPMLRLAGDADSTYQPYAETNYQLTQNKMSYADNSILGAKNLLGLSKVAFSDSINGVTLTKNNNGSFTLNGTATADTFFKLLVDFPTSGKYIFSGMNTGSYNNTYWIWLGNISNGNLAYYQGKAIYSDTKESVPFDITQLKTYSGTAITIDNLCIWITVKNGTTLNNRIIYPMIRLASDPDSTYQSYAMTNKELTNQKIDLYGLTSSTAVWQGDTLTFKITPHNGIMYHLIAMEAARQDTDKGKFCEAYIIMRAQGATAPNIRNRGTDNITGTWDASSSSLIITLPQTSYWLYRFSIEALHPTLKI